MTFAEEYRKRLYKVVEVPSGFKFKIRKLTMKAFSELVKVAPPAKPGEPVDLAKEDLDTFIEVAHKVLLECVVEPKLAERPKKDVLSVYELSAEDQQFLLFEILKLSGLAEEQLEELERFR